MFREKEIECLVVSGMNLYQKKELNEKEKEKKKEIHV